MDISLKKLLKQVLKKVPNKVRSLRKVLKIVNLLTKGIQKSKFNQKRIFFNSQKNNFMI